MAMNPTNAGSVSCPRISEVDENTKYIQNAPVKEQHEMRPSGTESMETIWITEMSVCWKVIVILKENPQWIPKNLCQRECIHYIARPSDKKDDPNDPSCKCGNKKSSHDRSCIFDAISTTEWKTESDTKTNQTTAYGEVKFVGAIGSFATSKGKKYVRLEHDTDPNKVLELLRDHWKLGVPKLLISVTGGAKNFRMNPRLQKAFRKGLIKASLSTELISFAFDGDNHLLEEKRLLKSAIF
ncbi:transient receptor potential cation channel subfamily M member-like 2 [Anneissia japonica]|uniref:transient receptor potential cation channel subfamily M member-like 2 n=1 Tax=Anneissia japonica TaxID=1529436 RepID=UPI0014254F8D|nr:transient receptor potential cation channel subfamily M member-like 2 [Anneissia japonica]